MEQLPLHPATCTEIESLECPTNLSSSIVVSAQNGQFVKYCIPELTDAQWAGGAGATLLASLLARLNADTATATRTLSQGGELFQSGTSGAKGGCQPNMNKILSGLDSLSPALLKVIIIIMAKIAAGTFKAECDTEFMLAVPEPFARSQLLSLFPATSTTILPSCDGGKDLVLFETREKYWPSRRTHWKSQQLMLLGASEGDAVCTMSHYHGNMQYIRIWVKEPADKSCEKAKDHIYGWILTYSEDVRVCHTPCGRGFSTQWAWNKFSRPEGHSRGRLLAIPVTHHNILLAMPNAESIHRVYGADIL